MESSDLDLGLLQQHDEFSYDASAGWQLAHQHDALAAARSADPADGAGDNLFDGYFAGSRAHDLNGADLGLTSDMSTASRSCDSSRSSVMSCASSARDGGLYAEHGHGTYDLDGPSFQYDLQLQHQWDSDPLETSVVVPLCGGGADAYDSYGGPSKSSTPALAPANAPRNKRSSETDAPTPAKKSRPRSARKQQTQQQTQQHTQQQEQEHSMQPQHTLPQYAVDFSSASVPAFVSHAHSHLHMNQQAVVRRAPNARSPFSAPARSQREAAERQMLAAQRHAHQFPYEAAPASSTAHSAAHPSAQAFETTAHGYPGAGAAAAAAADADSAASERGATERARQTSTFRGVSCCGKDRKWQARIRDANRVRYLGRFSTELEAALVYDNASRSLKGDAAPTNFVRMSQDTMRALQDAFEACGAVPEDMQHLVTASRVPRGGEADGDKPRRAGKRKAAAAAAQSCAPLALGAAQDGESPLAKLHPSSGADAPVISPSAAKTAARRGAAGAGAEGLAFARRDCFGAMDNEAAAAKATYYAQYEF